MVDNYVITIACTGIGSYTDSTIGGGVYRRSLGSGKVEAVVELYGFVHGVNAVTKT